MEIFYKVHINQCRAVIFRLSYVTFLLLLFYEKKLSIKLRINPLNKPKRTWLESLSMGRRKPEQTFKNIWIYHNLFAMRLPPPPTLSTMRNHIPSINIEIHLNLIWKITECSNACDKLLVKTLALTVKHELECCVRKNFSHTCDFWKSDIFHRIFNYMNSIGAHLGTRWVVFFLTFFFHYR